jgi:hypothetical protein
MMNSLLRREGVSDMLTPFTLCESGERRRLQRVRSTALALFALRRIPVWSFFRTIL